jgi:hypothetical protein
MASIPRPPRLPTNPVEAVQMLSSYLHTLFAGIVTEAEIPDRIDRVAELPFLSETVSNPPTQAEMQEVVKKVNAIIRLMRVGETS